MKLADNFVETLFLYEGKVFAKQRMQNLFVFEEGDLEKYPDSKNFLEPHWEGSDLLRTFNDFKRQYGFFRKKNSPAEILAQKDIEERFPFKAMMKVWYMRQTFAEWKIAEESAKEILNRYGDIPKAEFLNELNKEEN